MIEWVEGTIPRSKLFDDTYYSKSDGLTETQHVFINGNRLPERWPHMQHCTIGELGFGTGLNFLGTALAWQHHAAPGSTLEFISFEQYPMNAACMRKALSRWPQLSRETEILANAWANTAFDESRLFELQFTPQIRLSVHLGDANIVLPKIRLKADAWYLDGFSPAKNPELWNEDLMKAVGRATITSGTFATYTSAGFVRRNLKAAGFEVKKTQGHSGKREMSVGTKTSQK